MLDITEIELVQSMIQDLLDLLRIFDDSETTP